MHVLSNLSNLVKSYGHLSEILAFLPQALTKYGKVAINSKRKEGKRGSCPSFFHGEMKRRKEPKSHPHGGHFQSRLQVDQPMKKASPHQWILIYPWTASLMEIILHQ